MLAYGVGWNRTNNPCGRLFSKQFSNHSTLLRIGTPDEIRTRILPVTGEYPKPLEDGSMARCERFELSVSGLEPLGLPLTEQRIYPVSDSNICLPHQGLSTHSNPLLDLKRIPLCLGVVRGRKHVVRFELTLLGLQSSRMTIILHAHGPSCRNRTCRILLPKQAVCR